MLPLTMATVSAGIPGRLGKEDCMLWQWQLMSGFKMQKGERACSLAGWVDKGGWRGFTDASSTSFARPSFSGRMWSGCAMGRQCSVLEMNSMSSRSMSRTTRIFAFA